MPEKPDITLFADASVSEKEERAGWGAWIKGDDRYPLTLSGGLPWHPNSGVAELRALRCAIAAASEKGYFRPADKVIMVQSDNSDALGWILGLCPGAKNRPHGNSAQVARRRKRMRLMPFREDADAIVEVLGRHSLRATVRHVRGHTSGTGRQWVNRECDRLAKLGRSQDITVLS